LDTSTLDADPEPWLLLPPPPLPLLLDEQPAASSPATAITGMMLRRASELVRTLTSSGRSADFFRQGLFRAAEAGQSNHGHSGSVNARHATVISPWPGEYMPAPCRAATAAADRR
jgi:hypothetical protein